MQTENPFLDGLAKILTDAAGAAQGARTEFESFVKQRLEKLIAEMDFVPRDEFEAVKAMAAKARSETLRLQKRLDVFERRIRPPKRRIPPKGRGSRKL